MKKLFPVLPVRDGCPVAGGFVDDVLFAGIPHPDATPGMQARYEHHAAPATKNTSKKKPSRHDTRV